MSRSHLNKQQSASANRAHEAIKDLLSAYAVAGLFEEAPAQRYPEVVAHLESCAECRAELDELLNVVRSTYAGEVEPALAYPQPDLARLTPPWRKAPDSARPWLIDRLGRLWVEFSEALLATLQPQPFASAWRGNVLKYQLDLEPPHELGVTIEIFPAKAGGDMAYVEVGVDVATRKPFDQAGTQVVLYANEHTWSGETDDSGCIAFEQIPWALLPKLRLAITPQR